MLVKSLCFLAKQRLLKGTKACKIEFCEHCVLGKQQRVKFGIAIHNTKGILDYVHSDVWGPAKTPSIGSMPILWVSERMKKTLVDKVCCMLSTLN